MNRPPELTLIACRTTHNARNSDDGGYTALFAARDSETGAIGHVAYTIEWAKRDIMSEEATTDNPALVWHDNNSPAAYRDFSITDDTDQDPIRHPAWAACTHRAWVD